MALGAHHILHISRIGVTHKYLLLCDTPPIIEYFCINLNTQQTAVTVMTQICETEHTIVKTHTMPLYLLATV
jgi:hypothetical protein